MSRERTFEGESGQNNLQEALSMALQRLSADIGADGTNDGLASWTVNEISGKYGGFVGLATIKVRITTIREPEWGLR